MDRLVVNSVVALGTVVSLILIIGLVELQPVEASTDGYGPASDGTAAKISTLSL